MQIVKSHKESSPSNAAYKSKEKSTNADARRKYVIILGMGIV